MRSTDLGAVLIDGRPLQGATGHRGVGYYVRDLARGLLALDQRLAVTLLVDPRLAPPAGGQRVDGALWARAWAPPGPALLWGRLLGPHWIRRSRCDLWHATFLAPPRVPRATPWVATIHDLIPLRHPRQFSWRQRAVFSRSLALAARAPRVVVVSRSTADLVHAALGTPHSRLVVVPNPVDVDRFAAVTQPGIHGVDAPYLLHLGGFDPLKGVCDLLLPAFAAVARTHRDVVLVLAGPDGPHRSTALRVVADLGLSARVRLLGRLDEAPHAAAVAGAAAVVVSSWEEGFGRPAVEALAAGVPVAVGPAEATRELTRGAAALSPDASPTGLARAIEAALESGGPDSADGEERRWHAARFDFRTVALEMLEVYRTTLGNG